MDDHQTARLRKRVRELASSLAADPGVGGHVHFDDPDFAGLVPAFTDPAWIAVGGIVAEAASGLGVPFVVVVPLGHSTDAPQRVDLASIDVLSLYPHEAPPSLNALPEASAYERRAVSGDLVSDEPDTPAAHVWIGRRFEDDPGLPSPVWTYALYFETKKP